MYIKPRKTQEEQDLIDKKEAQLICLLNGLTSNQIKEVVDGATNFIGRYPITLPQELIEKLARL